MLQEYHQIGVCVPAFNSFGCISWSAIAGSYGNSVFSFLEEQPNCLPGVVLEICEAGDRCAEARVGSDTRKWSEREEDGPQEHSRSPSDCSAMHRVVPVNMFSSIVCGLGWLYLGAG